MPIVLLVWCSSLPISRRCLYMTDMLLQAWATSQYQVCWLRYRCALTHIWARVQRVRNQALPAYRRPSHISGLRWCVHNLQLQQQHVCAHCVHCGSLFSNLISNAACICKSWADAFLTESCNCRLRIWPAFYSPFQLGYGQMRASLPFYILCRACLGLWELWLRPEVSSDNGGSIRRKAQQQ